MHILIRTDVTEQALCELRNGQEGVSESGMPARPKAVAINSLEQDHAHSGCSCIDASSHLSENNSFVNFYEETRQVHNIILNMLVISLNSFYMYLVCIQLHRNDL